MICMEKRENFSRKRKAILTTLMETTVHPTADWVHAELKDRYPNLSLGTVYRNLKKFCETDKAVSLGVIGGQEHFDGNTTPHSHFVCNSCRAVLDVHETFFSDQALAELSHRMGSQVSTVFVLFRGTCPACQEKAAHQEEDALPQQA